MENVFQRYYSLYQSNVESCADEESRGRTQIHADSIGFQEKFPTFAMHFSPFAGDDSGFFFPAYEKDKVYVTFDHGDVSSPMVMGSSWVTRGDFTPAESGVPAEFVKTEENDEGKEIGVAPTVRGIKVRAGSAFVFDETKDEIRVEMWTGETQGIGKRAIKNHRVRLDSTKDKGQIVVATFGDENSEAEAASDEDTAAIRDKKELEGRLRHQILMRDTSDDRFIEVKTVGTDAMMKFHKFLMSDTEEKISLNSSDQHFIQISDKEDSIIVETLAKFRTIWDEKNKKIITETPGLQKITMDDNATSITIETASKQQIIQDKVGTLINEPVGKFDVIATTASTHTYAAAWTVVANAMTMTAQAAFLLVGNALTLTGQATIAMGAPQVTITSPQVTIASANVLAGSGTNLPLLNTLALVKYNTHFHIVVGPFPGVSLVPFSSGQMIPLVDTTVALLGA